MALEAELEELVALSAGIVHGRVVLGDTVRDADYAGGLEGSTGQGTFVPASCGVGVDCIDAWRVASNAICCVRAVRSIECIQEGIETTICESFNEVIDLIQGDGLWLSASQSQLEGWATNIRT